MKFKLCRIFILFFLIIFINFIPVYATDEEITEKITDIYDTWKDYSDKELNQIIGNSDDLDVASFLCSLTEDEIKEILSKDTMLLNEITFYEPTEFTEEESDLVVESKKIYWEYLFELAYTPQPLAVVADTKTGYFYLQIKGDGKTTKRKIQIKISGTNLSKQYTATFSEVSIDGYSDNHSLTLKTSSSDIELATQSGSQSYYEIAVLKFTYKKPAHYKASADYSGKCDGYRFNFKPYSLENEGDSTINNTEHNTSATTETIQCQINLMNAGFWEDENGDKYHATGKINLALYYGGLKVNPNSGNWNSTTSTSSFTAKCTSTKSIANPTRTGYTFTGWTISQGSCANGSINRNTSGSTINSSGCTFTYCGEDGDNVDVASKHYTTLKANWSINSYTVTCIDVIGSNSSGTKLGTSTWSANYNSTVYGSYKGSSTTTGTYYTGYYYTGCSSATVGTSGATVYRYFSPAQYTVTCIDVIESSGAQLRNKYLECKL